MDDYRKRIAAISGEIPLQVQRAAAKHGFKPTGGHLQWKPRSYSRDELLHRSFRKYNDWGQRYVVHFHDNGTLTECWEDDPGDCWGGEWFLTDPDGYLVTRIGYYEVLYTSGVGLELSYEDPERRIFFRLEKKNQ